MFGFKRVLTSWKFNKSCMVVNTDDLTLSVEGKPIINAHATPTGIQTEWLDAEWEGWKERQGVQRVAESRER